MRYSLRLFLRTALVEATFSLSIVPVFMYVILRRIESARLYKLPSGEVFVTGGLSSSTSLALCLCSLKRRAAATAS